MRVIGIDPDTKSITWAIIDTNQTNNPSVLRVEDKGRRAEDRFPKLVERFAAVSLSFSPCTWVYIERPMVGPNRKAAIDQGMVIGAIRAMLLEWGIPHSLVAPATWKKAVLGTGQVSKDEIKAWAIQHYGLSDNHPQDFYDAVCISHFGVKEGVDLKEAA